MSLCLSRPNITLSATSPAQLNISTTHTTYIPPHPAKGTPYHRYVLLLLPQSGTERITVPQQERLNFNVRAFIEEHNLGLDGGGAHMWRAVWDEDASRVWREILSMYRSDALSF